MKKNIITICALVLLSTSCTKNLEDLNTNIKDATEATGGSFFAFAVKAMADATQDLTYGANGNPFNQLRFFAQQISCNTYNEGTNYFGQIDWDNIYMDVLKNLDESKNAVLKEQPFDEAGQLRQKNQLAMIEIMNVYAYARLVEAFGDIPYTEALNIDNVTPGYDDGETVYNDLITRLDAAIGDLDEGAAGFGTYDLIYSGNQEGVTQWKRFANSLKLQMGLRIIDKLPEIGTSMVQEAATGVFTSNADNATLEYMPSQPHTNPLWVDLAVGNRQDFIAAAPLVDEMNRLDDPRRAVFFTTVNNEYVGAPYGEAAEYGQYSHFGDLFYTPTVAAIFIDYSTVEFLLAEAAERGLVGSPADAEAHYNKAITASFDYYDVPGADDYLAQPEVAYATAAATWQEKIGMQKWIALFNQGFEAWTEYRRLDFPKLEAPANAYVDIVPTRLLYPSSQQTLNGANWQIAADNIGGDLFTTKLFWDIH